MNTDDNIKFLSSIKNKYSQYEIVDTIPIGSFSWNCPTRHDEDWAILIKGSPDLKSQQRHSTRGCDCWVYPIEKMFKLIPYGAGWPFAKWAFEHQDCAGITWEEIKKYLIKTGYSQLLMALAKKLYPQMSLYLIEKHQYYCYLNYYTCLKESFELTEEELTQIQKVHDRPGATVQELIELKNNYEKYFLDILLSE